MKLPSDERGSGAVKSFMEHLEELRWTLLGCALALLLGMAVALPLAPSLFALLQGPLKAVSDPPDQFLRSLEVGGAFAISLRLALWGGLLLSSPFQLLLLGRFIFPGLFEHEKRVVAQAVAAALVLFGMGVTLCYLYALPMALKMMWGLHGWMGIRPEWTVTHYVAFATPFLIGFGLCFELPVILVALGRVGLITSAQLRSKRRHAIVGALVIGMVMTPPDVVSQVLMATPLILLYEISIWLVRAAERRRQDDGVKRMS